MAALADMTSGRRSIMIGITELDFMIDKYQNGVFSPLVTC